MSNNKKSMKLYTEEQVRKAFIAGMEFIAVDPLKYEQDADEYMDSLTPIELPSDSLCINCDESEFTHNICMDCIIKIGKENIKLPSDEEIKKEMEYYKLDPFDLTYFEGISYMRDKIQGGNK